MTNPVIPAEAVVDPVLAYVNAHYRPDVAADLLAAAQPLMAIAWDEGEKSGHSNRVAADRGLDQSMNPYKKETNDPV